MKKFWRNIFPPLLAILIMAGTWLDARRLGPPPDAAGYHARIRRAGSQVPLQSGDWIGADVPLPYDVMGALHPNLLISRHYQNAATGQGAAVLLVQCEDALTLQDHYPPSCYPNTQGYILTNQSPCDWEGGGMKIRGMIYEFSKRRFDAANSRIVADLMILPNGRYERDMAPVHQAANDARTRFYGAGQMQVLFDPQTPARQRNDIVRAMLRIFEPALNAIAAPVQAEKHP